MLLVDTLGCGLVAFDDAAVRICREVALVPGTGVSTIIGTERRTTPDLAAFANGAAFRSRGRVRVEDFRWLQGEELVSYYESSPGFHRGFCSRCGSPVVNRPAPNYARAAIRGTDLGVPLGILDCDPGVRPERHIFVGSKAPWFEITDDLPRHDELPS